MIYLLKCARCFKVYVGSTITTFRKRFNNHKSSLRKYGQGIRHMAGEHLYAHFFGEEHEVLADLRVIIIDKTNMNDPRRGEAFWAYNLDKFAPKGRTIRKVKGGGGGAKPKKKIIPSKKLEKKKSSQA